MIGIPTSFTSSILEQVVTGLFGETTLTLRNLKVHKEGDVKAKMLIRKKRLGAYVLDVDIHEVQGILQPGKPTLQFARNRVEVTLPVHLAEGAGNAELRFEWDSKAMAAKVACGDLKVTRAVTGGVVPEDYVVNGQFEIASAGEAIVLTPSFPDLAVRIYVDPSEQAWAIVDEVVKARRKGCEIALNKVDIKEKLAGILGRGFNVKIPQKIFKPIKLPAGVQPVAGGPGHPARPEGEAHGRPGGARAHLVRGRRRPGREPRRQAQDGETLEADDDARVQVELLEPGLAEPERVAEVGRRVVQEGRDVAALETDAEPGRREPLEPGPDRRGQLGLAVEIGRVEDRDAQAAGQEGPQPAALGAELVRDASVPLARVQVEQLHRRPHRREREGALLAGPRDLDPEMGSEEVARLDAPGEAAVDREVLDPQGSALDVPRRRIPGEERDLRALGPRGRRGQEEGAREHRLHFDPSGGSTTMYPRNVRSPAPKPTRMRPSFETFVTKPVLYQPSKASGTPWARR